MMAWVVPRTCTLVSDSTCAKKGSRACQCCGPSVFSTIRPTSDRSPNQASHRMAPTIGRVSGTAFRLVIVLALVLMVCGLGQPANERQVKIGPSILGGAGKIATRVAVHHLQCEVVPAWF